MEAGIFGRTKPDGRAAGQGARWDRERTRDGQGRGRGDRPMGSDVWDGRPVCRARLTRVWRHHSEDEVSHRNGR